MSKLSADRVHEIFVDCLFREEEDSSNHIKAEGILGTVDFHPERLEGYREEIWNMLLELPEEFMQSKGGGWSFLNACNDKNGSQWTGLHQRMDQLFQLGIAIGKISCQLPRDLWKMFPGGMPYYSVDDSE